MLILVIISIPATSTIHLSPFKTVAQVYSGSCLRKMSAIGVCVVVNAFVRIATCLNHVVDALVVSVWHQIEFTCIERIIESDIVHHLRFQIRISHFNHK
ncbi:unknown [Prevotella sp. CAG:891]|nr:unknown [Prevotella sp. CAG:891]